MSVIAEAISKSRNIADSSYRNALELKKAGSLEPIFIDPQSDMPVFRQQSAVNEQYRRYKGWVYSGISAIAKKGAGQEVTVSRITGQISPTMRNQLAETKGFRNQGFFRKKAEREMEVLLFHPLLDILHQPNPTQNGWEFVYNFITNLCLTGWSFVVAGEGEDGKIQLWSLPTTWVTPIHKSRPFSSFKIQNPDNSNSKGMIFPREQVAFAHIPDPSDPLAAYAPAQSQLNAIRIDDHIQTSQERFFQNGIFPSSVITVAKDGNNMRPKLTAAQRRQLLSTIKKNYQGVYNAGHPAIVEGWIEKFERLSFEQQELGWEKSEDKIRDRILTGLQVSPHSLGKLIASSYAQAYVVQEQFCDNINTYLSLLGRMTTSFVSTFEGLDDNLVIRSCKGRQRSRLSVWRISSFNAVTLVSISSYLQSPPTIVVLFF